MGVVSFTLRLLYPCGNDTGTHWIGGWVNPRDGLDAVTGIKTPRPYTESNPGRPASGPVSMLTELPRLLTHTRTTDSVLCLNCQIH